MGVGEAEQQEAIQHLVTMVVKVNLAAKTVAYSVKNVTDLFVV